MKQRIQSLVKVTVSLAKALNLKLLLLLILPSEIVLQYQLANALFSSNTKPFFVFSLAAVVVLVAVHSYIYTFLKHEYISVLSGDVIHLPSRIVFSISLRVFFFYSFLTLFFLLLAFIGGSILTSLVSLVVQPNELANLIAMGILVVIYGYILFRTIYFIDLLILNSSRESPGGIIDIVLEATKHTEKIEGTKTIFLFFGIVVVITNIVLPWLFGNDLVPLIVRALIIGIYFPAFQFVFTRMYYYSSNNV